MVFGLNDMIDMFKERHAIPEQVEHVKNWKEIGLGVMALADMALSMRMGYGTPEFIEFLDDLMKTMANAAAQASSELARTKGVYPKYNFEQLKQSRFYQEVYTDETKELIEKYGMANSRLLSIAPTGSISNILGVSGGIEPYFKLNYTRRIISMFESERTIDVWEKTPLALAKALGIKPNDLPGWAKITSQNIDFADRLKVQSTIQKYVDTAISSTFNLNNSATTEDIENIYISSWKAGLKGNTVFRDRCAKIGILAGISKDTEDLNPATPPTIEVHERWTNKDTGVINEFVNKITINGAIVESEKIEKEMCPLCGSHLIKKQGCTQCSNPDCYFEKCSI